VVVTDLQRSMEAYWKLLGIGPWKIYTYAPPMQARGEGLHHIQSRVENIEEVLAAFERLGIGVLMSGKFGEGEFYYLDTEPILGVVYEIFRRKSRPAPDGVYPPE